MEVIPSTQARVNKRKLFKSTKSRNGCLRCKSKRLKCDESKPACHQCVSRNASCVFQASPLVWSTRHEKVTIPVDKQNHTLEELIFNAQRAIVGSGESDSFGTGRQQAVLRSVEHGGFESSSPPEQEVEPASPAHIESPPRPPSPQAQNSLSVVRRRLQQSTVPEFMVHLPTELVHHYFSQVCQIFSSFDGSLNPFRTTIGKLFQNSAPIYYGIQSMAAAYLANHFPRMALVGVQMQQEAYKCLYQSQILRRTGIEGLDRVLLSMLLVGQTTSWHVTGDLGLQHLDMAKRLNRRRIAVQKTVADRQVQRQNQFFNHCLLYWDMVASYVSDRDEVELEDTGQSNQEFISSDGADDDRDAAQVFPHPWTGVAAEIQRMFCQAGRLIRRYRRTLMSEPLRVDFLMLDLDAVLTDPAAQAYQIVLRAQALEERLLAFELPSVTSIVDAGDDNTPPQHYILLAEAYRCAALLGIYRVFPSVFHQRSPLTDGTSQQFFHNLNSGMYPSPSEWLVSLAIHTLALLEQIPITSGTRCLQPLVFIIAAAELRFPTTSAAFSPLNSTQPTVSSGFSSISKGEIEVAHMRQFVMARIQEFKQQLPAKPILKAEQLIQETWDRSDLGQDIFWMDVMRDLKCETIFA